jgi:long-chain acyl-CoA synthetase
MIMRVDTAADPAGSWDVAARWKPWQSLMGALAVPIATESSSALDLFRAADPQAIALAYFDSRLSYAELGAQADRLAAFWRSQGVGRGDRVVLVLQNTPAFVVGVLAAWHLAAIVVPLNPMYRVPELRRLFDDCTPSAVICHDDNWDDVVQAAGMHLPAERLLWSSPYDVQSRSDTRVLPVLPLTCPPAERSLRSLLAVQAAPDGQGADLRDGNVPADVAVLLYTSGTTGVPKGAMLTHRNLVVNARTAVRHFALHADSRLYGLAPMFHVTGFELQMVVAFAASAQLVLTYRFQPAVVLDAFLEHRPTFIIGAITAFIALMNQAEATREHFDCFEGLYSGGAPIAPAVVKAFQERFGRSIRSTYGMTELCAPSHLSPPQGDIPVDAASGALAIGLPVATVDVIVVDDDGRPLGPGEPGELLVRGPNVMAGYWNKPAETAQALAGGWMHTGDVGFVDEAGWFYLVDRKKDMICASGFKVWPREVEDVLYAHPGVLEAAVVGAPDDYRGETVVAFVSPREGVVLDPDELVQHCRVRLAAYKCPTAVHVLVALPKTESGKITRATLARTLRGH